MKAHRAKKTNSGTAAKKKIPYIFYDKLLFLKDTIFVDTTTTNVTINVEKNKEVVENAHNKAAHSSNYSRPQRKKKVNKNDDIGKELIRILKRNVEKKNYEDDDHLFFMSLVKEFKKIPDHCTMQAKLDILKVIRDAQFSDHSSIPNTSLDWTRQNNPPYGYLMVHQKTHPYSLPMQMSTRSTVKRQETITRPKLAQSPSSSVDSIATPDSDNSHSSYIDLFNSIENDK